MATLPVVCGPITIAPIATVDGADIYVVDEFGRITPLPGTTPSKTKIVTLANTPGRGPEDAFVVDGPKDLGLIFNQEQILSWTALKYAIAKGLVSYTVAGTVPADENP